MAISECRTRAVSRHAPQSQGPRVLQHLTTQSYLILVSVLNLEQKGQGSSETFILRRKFRSCPSIICILLTASGAQVKVYRSSCHVILLQWERDHWEWMNPLLCQPDQPRSQKTNQYGICSAHLSWSLSYFSLLSSHLTFQAIQWKWNTLTLEENCNSKRLSCKPEATGVSENSLHCGLCDCKNYTLTV